MSCLLSVFVLSAGLSFGQFYNNGSRIGIGEGAVVYVKGMDLINADSAIYNAGKLMVERDLLIGKKPGSRIVHFNSGDSVFVFRNFKDSSLVGLGAGVLVLNGSAQTIESKSKNINSLMLNGVGAKTLASDIGVRTNLNLTKGHLFPATFTLLLDSTANISLSAVNANSFVVGSLFRKRKLGADDSLFFPVGNLITTYRPIILKGIATPVGAFPVFGVSTSLAAPQAGAEISSVYSRVWNLSNPSNASLNSVKLYYESAEVGASPASSLVVAQSTLANGVFNSIGARANTSAFVESEFKPNEAFYTIGASNFLRGNFKVLLEGAYNTSTGQMAATLYSKGILQDSLLKIYNMQVGYTVPANAVDRIMFTLIDSITGQKADSAAAWLLSDGHILDYQTGTRNYVTFANGTPGTNYFVYASHRNHLTASSKRLLLSSVKPLPNVYNFDYSKGVYGGGAMYHLGTNAWLLYGSDPYKSWKNQTDVVDLLHTWSDEDAGLYRITGLDYRYTDLNLDGNVNSADQSLANHHNSKLYYSTLPK